MHSSSWALNRSSDNNNTVMCGALHWQADRTSNGSEILCEGRSNWRSSMWRGCCVGFNQPNSAASFKRALDQLLEPPRPLTSIWSACPFTNWHICICKPCLPMWLFYLKEKARWEKKKKKNQQLVILQFNTRLYSIQQFDLSPLVHLSLLLYMCV